MRVGVATLVIIGAIAALVALGITDNILPATDPRMLAVRPWVAARALGIAAYLLLGLQVAAGLLLSHPRFTSEGRKTKQVLPWHEMLTVFVWAFLALHIVLLAVDDYAGVGVVGAFVPGLSGYRPIPVAIGSVTLYALIVTAATAKWTRLLPTGWWLKVHRFAIGTFLMAWLHAVLAGTDGAVLTPMYLATGLPILAATAHRWWTARGRPQRAIATSDANVIPFRRPMPVAANLEET
jgi:Ferric reductase like transmembrane component